LHKLLKNTNIKKIYIKRYKERMCKICDPKKKYLDTPCICHKSFKTFFEDYEKIRSYTDLGSIDIIKKWSISTMTICCNFNSIIDLQLYKDKYIDNPDSKSFYNCINTYITIKYQDKKKISLKIFKNGNIQLAGVLNVMSATYAVRKIYRRLTEVGAFLNPDFSKITDLRICMINSDFKITKNIKQNVLCDMLDARGENVSIIKRYTFDPSKYPGINLKIEDPETTNKLTVAIFRPGSIILTGGSDINLYYKTFKYIIKILNNNELLY